MTEIKVTITAPELTEAINNLAKAIGVPATATLIGEMRGALPTNTTSVVVEEAPVNVVEPAPVADLTPPWVTDSAPLEVKSTPPQTPVPAEAAQAPVGVERQYTLDELAVAGTSLIDNGKINEVLAILSRHNVDALTSLDPSQYSSVAAELRSLGANI